MCGRFNDHLPRMHAWVDWLGRWSPSEIGVMPSYNVAPSRQIAVQIVEADGLASAQAMRWGLIPKWSKEFKSKYATFNARIESIKSKPSYQNAWRQRQRCVIPMSGYYEWRNGDNNTGTPQKQAFYISDLNDGLLLAAGIYEIWGEQNLSCSMLTQPASQLLAGIHQRMPVLLTSRTIEQWLHASNDEVLADYQEYESPDLVFWPVSNAVGSPRNDHRGLIEEVALST